MKHPRLSQTVLSLSLALSLYCAKAPDFFENQSKSHDFFENESKSLDFFENQSKSPDFVQNRSKNSQNGAKSPDFFENQSKSQKSGNNGRICGNRVPATFTRAPPGPLPGANLRNTSPTCVCVCICVCIRT